MKNKKYLFVSILSLLFSQIPFLLVSMDSVYTSYCDIEAWFELQKCLIEPIIVISVTIIFYLLFFICLLFLINIINKLKK